LSVIGLHSNHHTAREDFDHGKANAVRDIVVEAECLEPIRTRDDAQQRFAES
jgi:hypothetical protein